VPIALDMLAKLASAFLLLGAVAATLWMCAATVALSMIRLKYPRDLTPVATAKNPQRKWGLAWRLP